MKPSVLTLLISSISLLGTAPALGQGSIESCEDYVARATSQVQIATGCNFSGPLWNPDPVAQMTWCKAASPGDRGRQDDDRRKALVGCRGDFGVVPIVNCNEYAARSRSQVELARSLGPGCTFEGMRWSSNVVQHMNWCSRNPRNKHEIEDAARRKELAACKANPR